MSFTESPKERSLRPEDDMHQIKKEMRVKEIDLLNQNAILKQKVELLEMELQECKERGASFKKMHETMLAAW